MHITTCSGTDLIWYNLCWPNSHSSWAWRVLGDPSCLIVVEEIIACNSSHHSDLLQLNSPWYEVVNFGQHANVLE